MYPKNLALGLSIVVTVNNSRCFWILLPHPRPLGQREYETFIRHASDKNYRILNIVRSDYCTVDGAGLVPYKVTKYWRTKAFKGVVMVGYRVRACVVRVL